MVKATKDLFANYANFNGRLSRSGYWLAILGYWLICMVAGVIDVMLEAEVMTTMITFVFWLPLLAAQVRRFHDTGRSGWQILWLFIIDFIAAFMLAFGIVFALVPMVGGVTTYVMPGMIAALIAGIILMITSIYQFVILLKKSEEGTNKYGEPNPFNEQRYNQSQNMHYYDQKKEQDIDLYFDRPNDYQKPEV